MTIHVVKDATKVRLVTGAGLIDAKVVQVDAANDLALLKADGRFAPLPIAASRTGLLGGCWSSSFSLSGRRGTR
jgi:S1-C subfamily serine protease